MSQSASLEDVRVSCTLVRVIADVVRQLGFSSDLLLDEHALSTGSDLSLSAFRELFARAVRLTGQPALGLLCGMSAREPSFDTMGPLISHARTLRHALTLAAQFHPLVMQGGSLHVTERADRVVLQGGFPRLDPLLDRGFAEFVVAGLTRLLIVYGGKRSELISVCFTHPRPRNDAAYAAAFRGKERFCQDFTGIEFCRHALDRPNLYAQPELHALLQTQAELSLERMSRPQTFLERLQALLRAQESCSSLDMDAVARRLGVSARSLRRRLDEEGTSFRSVADAARMQTAHCLLRDPELTLQAVSDALGFASASAFHRAFKRWTGLSPAQYRRQGTHSRTAVQNAAAFE